MRRIVPAACGVLLAAAAVAQAPAALHLQNLGLEHLDIIVPDTEASARFYARIFRTVLHQQPLQGGLRYFVLLGDLPADRSRSDDAALYGAPVGPRGRRICAHA